MHVRLLHSWSFRKPINSRLCAYESEPSDGVRVFNYWLPFGRALGLLLQGILGMHRNFYVNGFDRKILAGKGLWYSFWRAVEDKNAGHFEYKWPNPKKAAWCLSMADVLNIVHRDVTFELEFRTKRLKLRLFRPRTKKQAHERNCLVCDYFRG